jgi:hypothetical protein
VNLTTETVPLDALTPHPRNVRQGDVGAISESLRAHGQYRPIVAQRSTGHILAGNHTFKAAQALGWSEIAVTFLDVSDDQAVRIMLADNRTNDLATYDDRALVDTLRELSQSDEGLSHTLFTGDDLDDLLFKLEGDRGSGHDTVSISEGADIYASKNTRSIVLPYDIETYDRITTMCAHLRKMLGHDTNSDLVLHLIERHHAQS